MRFTLFIITLVTPWIIYLIITALEDFEKEDDNAINFIEMPKLWCPFGCKGRPKNSTLRILRD